MSDVVERALTSFPIVNVLGMEKGYSASEMPLIITMFLNNPTYKDKDAEELLSAVRFIPDKERFMKQSLFYFTDLKRLIEMQTIPEPNAVLDATPNLQCRYAIRLSNALNADGDSRPIYCNTCGIPPRFNCFKNVIQFICNAKLSDADINEVLQVILAAKPAEEWISPEQLAKFLCAGPGKSCGEAEYWTLIDYDACLSDTFLDKVVDRYNEMRRSKPQAFDSMTTAIMTECDITSRTAGVFLECFLSMGDECPNKNIMHIGLDEVAAALCSDKDLYARICDKFHNLPDSALFDIVRILLGACTEQQRLNNPHDTLKKVLKDGYFI